MVHLSRPRRFRFSIRSLMIAVAVSALLFVPILGTIRQQRLLALEQMRAADAVARAVVAHAGTRAISSSRPAISAPAAGKAPGLWAALGVNHSVFPADQVKDLVIEFTIVNDGDRPVDPGIAGSRIIVNGNELRDSALILGKGPRDARFTSLPPGDHIRFTSKLGDLFQAPGTYHVTWRGDLFLAPEVSFRVLPSAAH